MYSGLAAGMKDKFLLTAAADPIDERVQKIKNMSANPYFKCFSSAEELFCQPKLSDVLIISTQDSQHFENCSRAIDLGYDILLEKPVATNLREIFELESKAALKGTRIMVCFVLRFSPFYLKIKELISSGVIGDIISMNFVSGISPWRMAHSFVRGHWAVTEESAPTIVAKSCHDTDMIHWIIGKRCLFVSSLGSLNHFKESNAPIGVPSRCTDGCPAVETCYYNAYRYAGDKRSPWLPQIFDNAENAQVEEIVDWLRKSPWGRCVYKCGNNAPDHQVVAMQFENDITSTFTMTAFESGRHLEIYGTNGVIKGGETYRKHFNSEIIVITHSGIVKTFNVTENLSPVDLRQLRDQRLIERLYAEMQKPVNEEVESSISDSVQGHIIAFAAEEARSSNTVVDLNLFSKKFNN